MPVTPAPGKGPKWQLSSSSVRGIQNSCSSFTERLHLKDIRQRETEEGTEQTWTYKPLSMHTYTHAHTYNTRTHTQGHTYTHVHTSTHMDTHAHTRTHMQACTHTNAHACMQAHARTYTHACACLYSKSILSFFGVESLRIPTSWCSLKRQKTTKVRLEKLVNL